MIVLTPDFMTNICKKAAQHFHCAILKVFDRVKSVALRATVPQLTRQGLETTTSRIRDEHGNHYTTDADLMNLYVNIQLNINYKVIIG